MVTDEQAALAARVAHLEDHQDMIAAAVWPIGSELARVHAFADALFGCMAEMPEGAGTYTPKEFARARRLFLGRIRHLAGEPEDELPRWDALLVGALREAAQR